MASIAQSDEITRIYAAERTPFGGPEGGGGGSESSRESESS